MAVEQVVRCAWNARPDQRGLSGRMTWNPHVDDLVHGRSSLDRFADVLIEALSLVPEWRYNIYYRRTDTTER